MKGQKPINKEDVSITVGSNLMRFEGERVHGLFEWLFERFTHLGTSRIL